MKTRLINEYFIFMLISRSKFREKLCDVTDDSSQNRRIKVRDR